MSDQVEIFKAVLEIEEKGDAKRAAAEVRALEKQIIGLGDALSAGAITQGEYQGASVLLAAQLVALRERIAGAAAEASKSAGDFTAAAAAMDAAAEEVYELQDTLSAAVAAMDTAAEEVREIADASWLASAAVDQLAEEEREIADASWLVAAASDRAAEELVEVAAGADHAAGQVYELTTATYELAKAETTAAAAINSAGDATTAAAAKSSAAAGRAGSAHAAAAGRTRNFGFAFLELSRAAEDAQYGIAGVLNNIPGIVMALGGSAGLIAAISLASVAIAQLVKHWDAISAAFGSGKVRTAAQEMEELRKKTSLTADEAERLGRADAIAGKVKENRAAKTEEEEKTEKGVDRAIAEAGADNVARGLLNVNPKAVDAQGEVPGALAELKKAEDKLRQLKVTQLGPRDPLNPINDKDIENQRSVVVDARKKLQDARGRTAEQMAATGALPQFFPGNLDHIIKEVEKNPAAFAGGDAEKGAKLLQGLRDSTPAARKAKEKAEAEEQARDSAFDDNIAAGKRRKADARAISARLGDGPLGALAEDGTLSDAAVGRAMRRSGSSAADVARLGGTVGDQLRRGGQSRVREYAGERGITEAEARKRMAKERGDKEAKAIGVDPTGLVDPNADLREIGRGMIAAQLGGGSSPEAAYQSTYRRLLATQGERATRGAMGLGTLRGAMEDHELNRPRRTSQVIDSAAVADAVQQGVGGQADQQKVMVSELRKLNQSVTTLNRTAAAKSGSFLAH